MFLLWLLFYSAQTSRSTSGTSITPLAALHQTDHFLLGVINIRFLALVFHPTPVSSPRLHFNPRFPQSLGANREQRSLFFVCLSVSTASRAGSLAHPSCHGAATGVSTTAGAGEWDG
jgi:hypothetical protein